MRGLVIVAIVWAVLGSGAFGRMAKAPVGAAAWAAAAR
ncbi:hypothetical protein M2351_005408 [Azospirillum canadense]|nr:hypothetical protein [Azospirillum canadense]